MCWPGANGREAHAHHNEEECGVPGPRDWFVLAHHFCVVVVECSSDSTCLDPDFLTVEEDSVEDNGSDSSKRESIRQGERS